MSWERIRLLLKHSNYLGYQVHGSRLKTCIKLQFREPGNREPLNREPLNLSSYKT